MVHRTWWLGAVVCCFPLLCHTVMAAIEPEAADSAFYIDYYSDPIAGVPDGLVRLSLEMQPDSTDSVSAFPAVVDDLVKPSRRLLAPTCAHIAGQVNKFANQGFNVSIKRFQHPEKCPQRCKSGYRGPKTGKYTMYCSAQSCACTLNQGNQWFRNVVLKDSGSLSIVDALPAGCPKTECIGGGFKLCQKCQ